MRKATIIIVAIAILAGGWWLISSWFSSPSPKTSAPSSTSTTTPFGSGETMDGQPVDRSYVGQIMPRDKDASSSVSTNKAGVKLFKISSAPVAGFVALGNASSTVVRYMDRGTGHIFDATISRDGQINTARITNDTISPVYEAYFKNDGKALIARVLDEAGEIQNIFINLSSSKATSTEPYKAAVTYSGAKIDALSVGGDAIYCVDSTNGNISSVNFQGGGAKVVWNSGFKSWRIGLAGNGLMIFNKPSAEIPGYAYRLSSSGGTPSRLVGPLGGLVAVANKTGDRIIYSYNDGSLKTATQNLTTKEIESISPATIADKCVWSSVSPQIFFCGTPINAPAGEEPDEWYKGISHWSDYIWKFDAKSQISTLISNPEAEFGVSIDTFRPMLSPDESYIVLMNKSDLSLWALGLK